MKTIELTGKSLDYAVAICEGYKIISDGIADWVQGEKFASVLGPCKTGGGIQRGYSPTTNWEFGGPIIELQSITLLRVDDKYRIGDDGFCSLERTPVWCAAYGQFGVQTSTEHQSHDEMYQVYIEEVIYGPTPLIAAMRCYIASKLGKEVNIPECLK
jgi:hypothetical protein